MQGQKPFHGRTNLRCWGLLGTDQSINVYADHLEYFVHDDAWVCPRSVCAVCYTTFVPLVALNRLLPNCVTHTVN